MLIFFNHKYRGVIKMKKIALIIFTVTLFTACSSYIDPSYNSYIYKGINFGVERNDAFKRGVQDGCLTASGTYRKDHESFNTSTSYRDGWGDGRLQCHGK